MALREIRDGLNVGRIGAEFVRELLRCEINMASRPGDLLDIFLQPARIFGTEINCYLDLRVSGAGANQFRIGWDLAFGTGQWETV